MRWCLLSFGGVGKDQDILDSLLPPHRRNVFRIASNWKIEVGSNPKNVVAVDHVCHEKKRQWNDGGKTTKDH